MRKVTASAVILTALTGCSQSGVPSTQWSFELPSREQADGIQLSADSSFATEISLEGFTGDGQSRTGAMMGPAFAQSNTDSVTALVSEPAGSKPTASQAAAQGTTSEDFSALVTTATNPRANAFVQSTTQATARPDPLAQARSYLNRTSRPTAVISRVPYTSQVYLPSTAVAAPLSALGSVPAAPVVPSVTPPSVTPPSVTSPPATLQSPSAPSVLQPTAAIPTTPVPQQPTGQQPLAAWTTAPSSAPVAASAPNSLPSLYQEVPVVEGDHTPEAFVAEVPVVENDLPVLQPSQNVVAQNDVVQSNVVQSDVPIGTSILQELQRDADNSEPVNVAVVSQPDIRQSAQLTSVDAANSAAVPAATPAATQAIATLPEPAVVVQPVAVRAVQQPPTLARLLAGLPADSQAPDITTFRQPVDSSPANEAASQPNIELSPAEATTSAFSPLLSGLAENGDVSVSTLYVPIPDSEVADASAIFIQAAITALQAEALSAEAIQNLDQNSGQNSDQLARLLSSMRSSEQMPSLLQSVDLLPTEASVEENIQANSVKRTQPAPSDYSDSKTDVFKTNALQKQRVRKYRQRISWQSATI